MIFVSNNVLDWANPLQVIIMRKYCFLCRMYRSVCITLSNDYYCLSGWINYKWSSCFFTKVFCCAGLFCLVIITAWLCVNLLQITNAKPFFCAECAFANLYHFAALYNRGRGVLPYAYMWRHGEPQIWNDSYVYSKREGEPATDFSFLFSKLFASHLACTSRSVYRKHIWGFWCWAVTNLESKYMWPHLHPYAAFMLFQMSTLNNDVHAAYMILYLPCSRVLGTECCDSYYMQIH